jgi:hypothetical protein
LDRARDSAAAAPRPACPRSERATSSGERRRQRISELSEAAIAGPPRSCDQNDPTRAPISTDRTDVF